MFKPAQIAGAATGSNKATIEEAKDSAGRRYYKFNGCNMIDGVGADPYGTLILNHVQKKDGAKGTGGHFRIEIYGKKEDGTIQDKPIALLDDGPSAGVINAPIAGSTVTANKFNNDIIVAPKTA